MSTPHQVVFATTVTAFRNKPPRRDTTTLSNPTPEKTQQGYQTLPTRKCSNPRTKNQSRTPESNRYLIPTKEALCHSN